jgi:putative PIN family toxin of toxin-antitoxin system
MKKVVLDTNILVSAILNPEGCCRKILRKALNGEIRPLIGDALYYEYEDVFSREEIFVNSVISFQEREDLFNAFLVSCEWTKIYYKWRPNLRDEGDNHLIELAIAGNAPFIITRNIRDLKSGELFFQGLHILSPEKFIEEI